MDKTLITDLKKKLFLRSALIPIDGLSDLLDLNDTFSADEILEELFKKSLRAFEFHYPLVTEFRISKDQLCGCRRSDGWCEIKSNFPLYLKCLISEDQIVLVPNATPKIRIATMSGSSYYGSYPYPGSYSTSAPIAYERPFIYMGDMATYNQFWMHGIYSRPAIFTYNPDKTFSPEGAIYWMNIEEGVLGQKFVDQCMVDLLDYIRGLKSNLQLPSLPVQMFEACDVYYQQLKSDLDNFYLQSSWRGDLLV